MISSFDDAARVISVQAFEPALREIHFQARIFIHRLFDVFNQLIIGILDQDAVEACSQGEDIVSAVTTKHDRLFRASELLATYSSAVCFVALAGRKSSNPFPSCESKL